MSTITDNTTNIKIDGAYKDFVSSSGSTTSVINFASGDAPASADAGRFLMWLVNTSDTSTWQIRYIESATATSVTVGDGGFSSAPASGDSFKISTNLDDIDAAINDSTKFNKQGSHYEFVNKEWLLDNGAFLADVDKSIGMTNTNGSQWNVPAFRVKRECAIQFGRLKGGEGNNSFETTQGCRLHFKATGNNKLIFGTNSDGSKGAENRDNRGCVLNFYGCLLESTDSSYQLFIRAGGALRLIGTVADGVLGGRFYHEASEIVDVRFSGNRSTNNPWSSAATLTRPITNAFFFDNNTAIKAFSVYDATFTNCKFADSNDMIVTANASPSLDFKFIDCTTFADNKISEDRGNYKQGKSINYQVTDSSGIGLDDVLVAVYDKNGLLQTDVQTSSSGAVSEIEAIFFNKPHGNAASNLAPFDIRIRKYGYTYLGFQSAVSEPIKQEVRLVENSELLSTLYEAQAITGISLDFTTSTVTLTEDHSAQALYDYYQYKLGESANMQYPEDFTKVGSSFDLGDWDLVVDGCTYTGDFTTTGTITRLNSGAIVGTSTDQNGTVILLPWSVENVEATATLQLYNVTQNLEIENIIVGGTAGSKVSASGYYDETKVSTGDNIRLRITCQAGVNAFLPFEAFGLATSVGISFRANQLADTIYNENGINADNLTTLSADYPNVQIDISDGDGIADAREFYAFYVKQTTTPTGIEQWFGAIDAIDHMNYRINTDRADIKLQNTGTIPLVISGARIFRDNGTSVLHANVGDQPITQDNGELIQYIKGQVGESLDQQLPPAVENAINGNATITGIDKNSKLIPALL